MGYFTNIYDSRHIKSRKVLAVFLSFVLVFSMSNIDAIANEAMPLNGTTGDIPEQVSNEAPAAPSGGSQSGGSEVTQPEEAFIKFNLEQAYVLVGGQACTNNNLYTPQDKDFVFQAHAEEGYEISEIKAEYISSGASVPVRTEGSTSTIDAANVTNDIAITVKTVAKDAPLSDAQINAQPANTPAEENEDLGVEASSLRPGNMKKLSIASSETGALEKWNGEILETNFVVTTQELDGVIIAVPKAQYAKIGLNGSLGGSTLGVVAASALEGVAGIDASYTGDYYLIVINNTNRDTTSELLQTFQLDFGFEEGITPSGKKQSVEAYIFEGIADSEGGLLGSGIVIADEAAAIKAAPSKATTITSKIESIDLTKAVESVSDGGFSSNETSSDLKPRPFADTGLYSITYKLALTAEQALSSVGRQHLIGPVTIHDELSGFLAAGIPEKITIKGTGVNRTISKSDIEAGADGTKYAFSFEAPLSSDGVTLSNLDYTVTVEYAKDAYTDMYQQTENLLGNRVQIENSAYAAYTSEADGDTATEESVAKNAIGYKQLAPSDLTLKIQKKLLIKSKFYDYNLDNQMRYPADTENDEVKLTFQLVGTTGEGAGETVTGTVNEDGIVLLTGFKPNSTYTLKESQGIENFNSFDVKEDGTTEAVTVEVGALVNNAVKITINGDESVDYGASGAVYAAVNKAEYDGTISVTVEQQNVPSGTYTTKRDYVVTLYKEVEGQFVEVSSLKTNATGQAEFANLDPAAKYEVRGQDPATGFTVNNPIEIAFDEDSNGYDKNDTEKGEPVLQYTSTSGGLQVGKTFKDAGGETPSDYTATFELVNKEDETKKYIFTITADGELKQVSSAIEPGNYLLSETAVSNNQNQYESGFLIGKEITIEAGKFDTSAGIIENVSTYGQLKIKNFDYGNTGLTGAFGYTITPEEGDPIVVSLPADKSELIVDVPAGKCTVKQTTTPDGFIEVLSPSGSIEVVPNAALFDDLKVVGTDADSFTFDGTSLQVVGFINATLPSVEGMKVSTQKQKQEDGTEALIPLEGAEFDLYYLGKTGLAEAKKVQSVVSDADGKISLNNLEAGEYELREIQAPEGYVALTQNERIKFTVFASADYSTSKDKKIVYPASIQAIENAPERTLKIKMSSTEGDNSVAGAVFELRDSLGTVISTVTSSNEGYIEFPKTLAPGNYTIHQTSFVEDGQAATEYIGPRNADNEAVNITISDRGDISGSFGGDSYAHSTLNTETGEVRFSNLKKPTLRIYKTGDTNVFDENGKRTKEPISGAKFEFYENGEGLLIEGGNRAGIGAEADTLVTSRGYLSVGNLDPDAIYSILETYAPNIEGTDTGRQLANPIPDVEFEIEYKDGEIFRYIIAGQTLEPDEKASNTIALHDPVENTYRIQVSKYTWNSDKDIVYKDSINGKFVIQRQVEKGEEGEGILGGTWETVETIVTGTASDIDLHTAISSLLPEGTYRIVEIKPPAFSPADNNLYDPNNDFSHGSNWTLLPQNIVETDLGDGVVWPNEIILGGAPDGTITNVDMGNDDIRTTGKPFNSGFHVQLHGLKQAFKQEYNEDSGKVEEILVGEIAGISFEVEFGYILDGSDEPVILNKLSNVVSGSVVNEIGGFITEYVWCDGNLVKDPETGESIGSFYFFLTELGPVPEHLIQPVEGEKFLVPVELPDTSEGGNESGLVQGTGGFYTLHYNNNEEANIKNYEAQGVAIFGKYNAEGELLDLQDEDSAVFNIYQKVNGEKGPFIAQVVLKDGVAISGDIQLLEGNYLAVEVTHPNGYNPNGKYSVTNGIPINGEAEGEEETEEGEGSVSYTDFDGATKPIEFSVKKDEITAVDIFDTSYAGFKLANAWNTLAVDDSEVTATYSMTYAGKYGAEYEDSYDQGEELEVKGKDSISLEDLPDGVYTLKETAISETDSYHMNTAASAEGFKVTIAKGKIESVKYYDGTEWKAVDGFDGKDTEDPKKSNIKSAGDVITVNHLPKAELAIQMGYIAADGSAIDKCGAITKAEFAITNADGFNETLAWENTGAADRVIKVSIALDPGVYRVQQTSVTDSGKYLLDGEAVYVRIGLTGQVTYLQNNTILPDYGAPGAVSSARAPLKPVAVSAAESLFFYNKLNAGKLIVVKQEQNTGTKLKDAGFEATAGVTPYTATSGSDGQAIFESIPVAPATGTEYTITETVAPGGYYFDDSAVKATVEPNTTTIVTVDNVPFTSITVHKDAQMPSYLGESGTPVEGATHPVEGLQLELYKEGSATAIATGTTDEFGNYTFTGLDVGEYRIVEKDNLDYLDVEGNTQYNSTNTATHFTVEYTKSNDNAKKAVAIKAAQSVVFDKVTSTLTIKNNYKDDALFIPIKKVDALTGDPLAGAWFRLSDENGVALDTPNNYAKITAKSDASGMAYLHFLPSNVTAKGESEPYEGDYYIKEITAPDGYVISPYEADYLKEAIFAGEKTAQVLIFEDQLAEATPKVSVTKDADATIEAPLTWAGFDATYTIGQTLTENKLPIKDYALADKGLSFKDAGGAAVVDSRLTYTITEIVVGKATVASGKPVYASVDKGATWKQVSGADQAFSTSIAGTGASSEPLFEVWYAEDAQGAQRIVGAGFEPGEVTVAITFDRFEMAQDAATSNDVKTITNKAAASGQYPTDKEDIYTDFKSTDVTATLTLPDMPTLEISKELKSLASDVKRGEDIQYELTLTNNSGKVVTNPVIIERAEPIDFAGALEAPMKVKDDGTGKPEGIVSFSGETLSYKAFFGADQSVAAWVFEGKMAPGSSITVVVTVTLNSVISADSIVNQAFGGAVPNVGDLSQAPDNFANDNKTGALFKPATGATVADANLYAAVSAAAGINSGMFVMSSVSSPLESNSTVTVGKNISLDGSSWQRNVDVLPGDSFYYRLQMQYDNRDGSAPLTDLSMLDVTPQLGALGTGWTNDLTSRLHFSEMKVWGFDSSSTYRPFVEGQDYQIVYSSATDYDVLETAAGDASSSDFNSFRIVFDDNIKLQAKQFITVTYKAEVPAIDEVTPGFTYDMLDDSARKDGVARFRAIFDLHSDKQRLYSNTAAAHLLAPFASVEGFVWDDQNRDGAYQDPEDSVYTAGTVKFEDITAVLYKASGAGWIEEATTALDADGKYSFSDLESSYGADGPKYKIEFVFDQGSATNSRHLTHTFSPGIQFANDGVADLSNVVEVTTSDDAVNTSIVGDSGPIRLLLKNENIVNAGINAIPYTVSYDYGTAPAGASALPAAQTYVADDSVTVAPVATAPGYDFLGWSRTGTFDMPAEDVVLTGVWVARGDTPYRIEYYLQNVDRTGYTINNAATINGQGKTDTTLNALIKSFAGFTHNPQAPGTLLSDTIRGDGSTVLRVYYDRSAYTVSYVYTGTVPPAAPGTPGQASYYYGQNVNVAGAPSLDGYTFSGWSRTGNFSMPAENVVISGSWDLIPVAPVVTPEDGGEEVITLQEAVDGLEEAMTALRQTLIGDDGTPLAQGEGKYCWVHPWIILGIIVTLIYAAVVVVRRRKFTRDLDNYEDQIFNGTEEVQESKVTVQPRFNGPLGAEG